MLQRLRFADLVFAAIVVATQVANRCFADEPKPRTADERVKRVEKEAERFFQPLIDRGWASGIVVGVVDEHGQRVFGFGRKKEGSDERPDGDTVFEIGSVTKVFTGTLLADMVERGLVSVDDPVNQFLPEDIGPLKRGDWEMQLAHTSSLPPRQPYEELLLERICRPLGMTSTRLTLDDSMAARLIPSHNADGKTAKKSNMACLAPCGGISAPTRMER